MMRSRRRCCCCFGVSTRLIIFALALMAAAHAPAAVATAAAAAAGAGQKLVLEFPSIEAGTEKHKKALSEKDFKAEALNFGKPSPDSFDFGRRAEAVGAAPKPEMLIEATSKVEHLIKDHHKNAFVGAAILAFSHHYPLELRPDHFWLLVLQGISKHVEIHAEQVRANFVNFKGKKELIVRADDFALGNPDNDWTRIFPQFVEQINKNTVEGVVPRLESHFTTTTPTDMIAGKITLMDVCKSFFEYTVMTMCGFPSITLHGTRADWVQLHEKIPAALALCEPGFASSWGAALSSVTQRFVKSFDGERDENFWQSMVKRGGTHGSGARTWYTGWINAFFPFGTSEGAEPFSKNRYCVPYRPDAGYVKQGLKEEFIDPFARSLDGEDCPPRDPNDMTYAGLDPQSFPPGWSETPAKWDYLGTKYELAFRAGFVGVAQDPASLSVTPSVGWLVLRSKNPAKD